ncbi:hypothetical protein B0A48_06749 [Cryoendolithus antarcticus]|uniref:Uncharacterized protein n=1 Tax=Cryoendolithus antarcticus TaxID=1507870 RepID=A0A1V8T969_9PEZI|nr:hypothetical protein B0A48_06749 [Cryoendolithus antarcticus]
MAVLETTVLAVAALYVAIYRAISKKSQAPTRVSTVPLVSMADLEMDRTKATDWKQSSGPTRERASGKVVIKARRDSVVQEEQSARFGLPRASDTAVIEGRRDSNSDLEQSMVWWAEVVEMWRQLQMKLREREQEERRQGRENLIRALWEIRRQVARVPSEVSERQG